MKRLTSVAIVAVVLLFTASVGFAARSTRCTDVGRIFSLTAGDVPISIRLVATNANTDADIGIFETETGDVAGLGLTTVSRWEEVVIGPPPGGVEYDIVVLKASGPNSTCYLYFFDDIPFNRPIGLDGATVSGPALRDKGSLAELARSDERYELMRQTMEKHQRAKALALAGR